MPRILWANNEKSALKVGSTPSGPPEVRYKGFKEGQVSNLSLLFLFFCLTHVLSPSMTANIIFRYALIIIS